MNKIAIIEDDIDICNMIAKFLENNEYIVHYVLINNYSFLINA